MRVQAGGAHDLRLPVGLQVVTAAAVALLVYLPLAMLLGDAFRDAGWRLLSEAATVLTSERRRSLLVTSLGIATGTALGSLLLAVPVALLLSRSDLPAGRLVRAGLLLTLALPSYLFALGWLGLFDPGGVLAGVAEVRGWGALLATAPGVTSVLVLRFFPLAALICAAALDRTDAAQEEAARLVRPTSWVLARVTLPLARAHLIAAALFVFNLALVQYTVPSLFRVQTFPVEIFAAYSGLFDSTAAAALALVLLATTAASIVLAWTIAGKRPVPVTSAGAARRPLWRLRGAGRIALTAAVWALLALEVLPVAGLVATLSGPADMSAAWGSSAGQIGVSLALAATTATLLLAPCLMAGYWMGRGRRSSRPLVNLWFLLPLAVPPTVLGLGCLRLWNQPATAWLADGPGLLLLAACALAWAPLAALLASAVEGVPRHQEEAASLAGLGWAGRARVVVVPALRPALVAAWVVAFVVTLDDVGAAILLQPPDVETLPVRIYNLAHYDAAETVAALCLWVLLILAAVLAVAGGFAGRPAVEEA